MDGKQHFWFDYSPCTPISEGDPTQAEDYCEKDLVNYATCGEILVQSQP